MKKFIVQFETKDGTRYHAYKADGSLVAAVFMQDAARFSTLEEAQGVAKNYVNSTILEAEVDEFAHRVSIINTSGNALPKYVHDGDSGMDIRASKSMKEPVTLNFGERFLVPTGLQPEIPTGMEFQIRPNSGLSHKHGITVLNSPGTIDASFRGEMKVNIINLGQEPYTIYPGEVVAQIVLARVEKVKWHETDKLSETTRGEGGHGSTRTGSN